MPTPSDIQRALQEQATKLRSIAAGKIRELQPSLLVEASKEVLSLVKSRENRAVATEMAVDAMVINSSPEYQAARNTIATEFKKAAVDALEGGVLNGYAQSIRLDGLKLGLDGVLTDSDVELLKSTPIYGISIGDLADRLAESLKLGMHRQLWNVYLGLTEPRNLPDALSKAIDKSAQELGQNVEEAYFTGRAVAQQEIREFLA